MSRLLASPRYRPWYWLCRPKWYLSYILRLSITNAVSNLMFPKVNSVWQGFVLTEGCRSNYIISYSDHTSAQFCGMRTNVVVFCRQLPDGALSFTGWVCFQVIVSNNTAGVNHTGIALFNLNKNIFFVDLWLLYQHINNAFCAESSFQKFNQIYSSIYFPYLPKSVWPDTTIPEAHRQEGD